MAQFRRRGSRTFYKLTDQGLTIKICNTLKTTEVSLYGNYMCEDSTNGPYRYKNPEIVAINIARQKLTRAASEFYKDRKGSFQLQKFEVEGIEFMAETKEDAEKIYEIALNEK